MFLQNFHIFINKRAMMRPKYTGQVTTLPDCDDITRFDGIVVRIIWSIVIIINFVLTI